MMQFLIRFCIVCCGVIVVGIMSGLHGLPFFGAMLFGCTWLCYRSFEMIAGWLIFFLVIVLIFFQQDTWLYLVLGATGLYAFDHIRAYLVRNNNASKWILFLVMVVLGVATVSIVHMIAIAGVSVAFYFDAATIIGVPVIFFVVAVGISYAESIIGLYVYSDQRCHT